MAISRTQLLFGIVFVPLLYIKPGRTLACEHLLLSYLGAHPLRTLLDPHTETSVVESRSRPTTKANQWSLDMIQGVFRHEVIMRFSTLSFDSSYSFCSVHADPVDFPRVAVIQAWSSNTILYCWKWVKLLDHQSSMLCSFSRPVTTITMGTLRSQKRLVEHLVISNRLVFESLSSENEYEKTYSVS
jgi:hypothetical protein